MKNIKIIYLLALVFLFSNCKKENDPIVTIVEGRLINQETQLPIVGGQINIIEIIQSSGLSYITKTTSTLSNEEGYFKFSYLELSDFRNTITWEAAFELELEYSGVLINGQEESLFFRDGKIIDKGGVYYFEIEFLP